MGNSEKISNQFSASHIIKNFLPDFKPFPFMNIFYIKSSIKSHVSGILKNGKFFICYYSGTVSSFGKKLIPLLYIATNNKPSAVLIKLIKMIRVVNC